MSTVTVEVHMSEIDDDDLVAEVIRRIKEKTYNPLGDKERKQLRRVLDGYTSAESIGLRIQSLDDSMKLEHLQRVWNKYTSADFERMLK